jgi:hypothetical protein
LERPLIFRNDDVSVNTNKKKLAQIYGAIHTVFPDAEIWSCITLFGQKNSKGSVYKDVPFKGKETNWFYKNIDSFMYLYRHALYKTASHGLFHIDHSKVNRQAQEMSIISSCAYLHTDKFVPPFNKYNQDTLDICFDNEIKIDTDGWKSLEFEPFDPKHEKWYFHSWRWEPETLKRKLNEHSAVMG